MKTKKMAIKRKVKNRETLSYVDWIIFKNYFVYNQNLSDKKSLLNCFVTIKV